MSLLQFPQLPDLLHGQFWPQPVIEAHTALFSAYSRAAQVVETGADPHFVKTQINYVVQDLVPILQMLSAHPGPTSTQAPMPVIPDAWITEAAVAVGTLLRGLDDILAAESQLYVNHHSGAAIFS